MKSLQQIDSIIFDLGGVILNLDFERTLLAFEKRIPTFDRRFFLGKKEQLAIYNEYEIGKISTEAFIREFNFHYQVELSLPEFQSCWNAMILDFPKERIDLITTLREGGKKVFLLSNINHLHEIIVEERFQVLFPNLHFVSIFDKAYYSHQIGLRKPSAEIFNYVQTDQKLDPYRTLFIDDSYQHVEAACAFGIQAIHLEKSNHLESLDFFN